jgi:hypothetical protein
VRGVDGEGNCFLRRRAKRLKKVLKVHGVKRFTSEGKIIVNALVSVEFHIKKVQRKIIFNTSKWTHAH